MSNEINTFLSKEPLKQAASTIYSIQKGGISKKGVDIRTKFTHLSPFFDMNLSFLERYLEDSLELLPPKYRKFTESKLKQYALPMGKIHKNQLQAIDFYNESLEG